MCRTWIPPKATPTLFSKPTVPSRPFDFSACYMHATLPKRSCTFVVHHKVLPNKCAAHGSPPRPRPHCSQSPPFHPGPLIFPHATCMQPCPKQVAPLLYIIKCSPTSVPHMDPPKATPTLFSKPTVPSRPFDFSAYYMHATLPKRSCTFVVHHKVLPNKCAAHGSPPRPRPHCSQSPPFHPGPLIFPHATCMQPCPKQVAPLLYIIKCSPTSVPHMDPPQGHAHTVLKAHRSTQAL